MADLTAKNSIAFGPSGGMTLLMDASQTFYAGALIGKAQDGYADSFGDDAGMMFAGIAAQFKSSSSTRKDTTMATQITGLVPARIPLYPVMDRLARDLTVAGTSAVVDNGKLVFCATDNHDDLTLTAPADDRAAVGIVWEWKSSTTCDVLFFTPMQSAMMTMIGTFVQFLVGQYNCADSDFGTGSVYSHTVVGMHGLIASIMLAVTLTHVGATSTVAVNAQVGAGTDIFAADEVMLAVATANPGLQETTTAAVIAAQAQFHDGDQIDVDIQDGANVPTAGIGLIFVNAQRYVGV